MINAITSLKIPKSVSKSSEVRSESSTTKSTNVQAVSKAVTNKKINDSLNVGLKVNLSNGKIHNQLAKDSLPNNLSSGSSNSNKGHEFSRAQGSAKCSSASATPVLSRWSSSNRSNDLSFISPCKTRRGREFLDLFPSSGNNQRWWEVLLPLKRMPVNDERPISNRVKENCSRVQEPQLEKIKIPSREMRKDGLMKTSDVLGVSKIQEDKHSKSGSVRK